MFIYVLISTVGLIGNLLSVNFFFIFTNKISLNLHGLLNNNLYLYKFFYQKQKHHGRKKRS